ncbi:PAS domain S-box protein [Candidatus Pacearchaeota archaeon]|nr:PAS domain S-box protein [Candidatus Pacearchaeota archaeon]
MINVNYFSIKNIASDITSFKEVGSNLKVMAEQVIGYDSLLTENTYSALLYAQKGDMSMLKVHEDRHKEITIKMNDLLKIEAPALLEKSIRSQESKEKVLSYFERLDEINFALVELESEAFEKMKQGDTETACSLITNEQHQGYKKELFQLYRNWVDEEEKIAISNVVEIMENVNKLKKINFYSPIILIIIIIIISFFISRAVSKPIKKLTSSVEEITKGSLEIQLEKSKIFEVQKLTDALNRILASLKLAILRTSEAVKSKEETENKYKILYETSNDAIMTLEPPTWKFTDANPATIKMFGAESKEEFLSKTPGDVSPKRQPNGELSSTKSKLNIMNALKTGKNFFNWAHKRFNGEEFPATVLLTKVRIKDKDFLQATVRDISGKKIEALKAKEKAEKRFGDIAKSSVDWIWEVDKDGKYTFISGKFKEILGYDSKEILGKTPFDFMPKEEAKKIGEIFKKIALNKEPIKDLENWNLTKSGKKILLLTNGVPILSDKGNLMGYRGIDKDITNLKEMRVPANIMKKPSPEKKPVVKTEKKYFLKK